MHMHALYMSGFYGPVNSNSVTKMHEASALAIFINLAVAHSDNFLLKKLCTGFI